MVVASNFDSIIVCFLSWSIFSVALLKIFLQFSSCKSHKKFSSQRKFKQPWWTNFLNIAAMFSPFIIYFVSIRTFFFFFFRTFLLNCLLFSSFFLHLVFRPLLNFSCRIRCSYSIILWMPLCCLGILTSCLSSGTRIFWISQ